MYLFSSADSFIDFPLVSSSTKMGCENCDRLAQLISKQQKQIARQQQQINLLLNKVAELEKKLAVYENSNKPPSAGGSYPKREPSGRKPGGQPGHEGTTRLEKEPDEVLDAPPLKECPNCHSALGDPFRILKEIFEELPEIQRVRIIQLNRGAYLCPGCGQVHFAADPRFPQSGRFGFNLMMEVVLMKFQQRLPLRRIQKVLHHQFKLDLSPATIWDLIRRVAAAGEEEFHRIMASMPGQDVVNADETGRKVDGKASWAWVFLSAASVLYLAARGRGREVIEEVLGKDFTGKLGCDGWKPYNFIKILQRCWAHLLRESDTLAQRGRSKAACWLHSALKRLFKKADKAKKAALAVSERQKIHGRLNKSLLRLIGLAKKHKATLKLAQKIENGMGHWFTAVLHPEIELTNNSAERALREIVVQRKISGLRSREGAHSLEVIMTLLGTWELRGQDPRQMLLQTLRGS